MTSPCCIHCIAEGASNIIIYVVAIGNTSRDENVIEGIDRNRRFVQEAPKSRIKSTSSMQFINQTLRWQKARLS